MVIAIDGYEANVGQRVGVSRYAYSIIRELYALCKNHIVRIYVPVSPEKDLPPENQMWKYVVGRPKNLWTFIGLPVALATDMPYANVVFSPTHYIPRFTNLPRVLAIMDLSYMHFPELFQPKDLYQLIHWTKYSAHHAKKILTISECSKRDILNQYKVPGERVVVTYPGLSLSSTMETSTLEKIRKKYSIAGDYILSVGTLQPRKNFVRLIEAFSHIQKNTDHNKSKLQLVIVGKKGWLYDDILQAPKTFNVSESVKFLDFVPDSDLPALYRGALCFALPSLYEGFGLPVLEAMANECLVVVSATSSLPEVAGSAGIYVDPRKVEDIEKGLLTAMYEHGKPAGQRRVRSGLERIKLFTWQKAAAKTLEVLESVAKGTV